MYRVCNDEVPKEKIQWKEPRIDYFHDGVEKERNQWKESPQCFHDGAGRERSQGKIMH